MSYLVFARKFRPQRFEDLLGQEAVVTTLRRAIEQQRIGQAYLFAGPRGTGKTSTARIFAKALNCEKGPTPTPCNKCSGCIEITEGRSLDVIEIDGASNRQIEDIRALRDNVKFAPVKGHFKIYIIDEFHQITNDAFNALLKTLEEPPAHVKFIFATTAPHKVPPTILSRCQRYEFKRFSQAVLLEKLQQIAKAEKIKAPAEALEAIARAAAGSLRDAESLLDQLAAFGKGAVQMADVQALLGVVEDELLSRTIDAIVQRQPLAALAVVSQLTDAGRDLTQFLMALIGYVRHLMVAQLGDAGRDLAGVTTDLWQRLTTQAGAFSEEELSYLFYLLVGAHELIRRVGDGRTLLEVTLIRASRREPVARIGELIRQLEQGAPAAAPASSGRMAPPAPSPRAAAPTPAPPRPAAPPNLTPRPSTPPATPRAQATEEPATASATITESAATPALALESLQAQWPDVMAAIQQRKISTAAYLLEAQPIAVAGDRLTIGFPREFLFHKEALERPEHRSAIEEVLQQVTGWTGRVLVEVVDGLAAAPRSTLVEEPVVEAPPPPVVDIPPVIRSAAELFGGRVNPPRR